MQAKYYILVIVAVLVKRYQKSIFTNLFIRSIEKFILVDIINILKFL